MKFLTTASLTRMMPAVLLLLLTAAHAQNGTPAGGRPPQIGRPTLIPQQIEQAIQEGKIKCRNVVKALRQEHFAIGLGARPAHLYRLCAARRAGNEQ